MVSHAFWLVRLMTKRSALLIEWCAEKGDDCNFGLPISNQFDENDGWEFNLASILKNYMCSLDFFK